MDFHVFKKKKKSEPKAPAPEPKAPTPAPAKPPAPPSAPKPAHRPPQDAVPSRGPRPSMEGGAYMDELERMSRVPGMRNIEVTTSRTFRWNFKDPLDGSDYEYYYQDHGPPMAHCGGMQRPPTGYVAQAMPPRPPRQLLEPQPEYQYGPPGPLVASSHPHYDYGNGGAPSAYGYNYGGGYYDDEYPRDCTVM